MDRDVHGRHDRARSVADGRGDGAQSGREFFVVHREADAPHLGQRAQQSVARSDRLGAAPDQLDLIQQ